MMRTLVLLLLLLSLLAAAWLPSTAGAEILPLSSTQGAACPACLTDHGGARVVNLFENLAGNVGRTSTYAGPTAGFDYVADAASMFSDFTSLDASGATITSTLDVAGGVASETAATVEVAGGIEAAASTSGLWPALTSSVTVTGILPTVVAGAGAFVAGFAIGTAGKYLIGKLFGGRTDSPDSWYQAFRWRTSTYYGAQGDCPDASSTPRYVLWAEGGSQLSYNSFPFFNLGRPRPQLSGPYRYFDGNHSGWGTGTSSRTYWASPAELRRGQALTSATSVPPGYDTITPNPTPSRDAITNGVASTLNSQAGTSLARWLQHELDPRCSPDPTRTTVSIPVPRTTESESCYVGCLRQLGLDATVEQLAESDLDAADGAVAIVSPDPGSVVDPGSTTVAVGMNPPQRTKMREDERCQPLGAGSPGADPGPAPGGDEFQAPPPGVPATYASSDPRITPPSAATVNLYWGTEKPGVRWGWRHIVISHGYSPVDQQETAAALLDPAPTLQFRSMQHYAYHKYYEVVDGGGATVRCARVVFVQFAVVPGESLPRHIMNSYAGAVVP